MRVVIRVVLGILLVLCVPAAALAAPAPLTVSVQPGTVGFLDTATNDLYVFGSVTCSHHTTVQIYTAVFQPDDQAAGRDLHQTVSCGNQPTFWFARLSATSGGVTYGAGPAQLSVGWTAGVATSGADGNIVIIPI